MVHIPPAQRRGLPLQASPSFPPDIHQIVADGAQAYVGSENFTTGSLQYNRELGLITTNPPAVKVVGQTIAADFAAGTAL